MRRTSSSLSETSSSAALMTFGPPILPSASAARLRTHQSASRIAFSRYLTELSSPTTFSTSTAARRACSTRPSALRRGGGPCPGACCGTGARSPDSGRRCRDRAAAARPVAGSTWPLPFAMARKRRRAHQLVRVLERLLQRGAHLGRVEAGEQRNDVRPRDGVLAVDARDEFVDGVRVHQLARDPEQGGLLVGVLVVGGVQELAQVEAVLLRRDDVEDRRLRDARALQQLEQQARANSCGTRRAPRRRPRPRAGSPPRAPARAAGRTCCR